MKKERASRLSFFVVLTVYNIVGQCDTDQLNKEIWRNWKDDNYPKDSGDGEE